MHRTKRTVSQEDIDLFVIRRTKEPGEPSSDEAGEPLLIREVVFVVLDEIDVLVNPTDHVHLKKELLIGSGSFQLWNLQRSPKTTVF